jgi:hypothetical protein
VVEDGLAEYWDRRKPDLSNERELPVEGIKATIYGITGYDELRIPSRSPCYMIGLHKNELYIEGLGEPFTREDGKKGDGVKFVSKPLDPSKILEFIVDGKSYPTAFRGRPFKDPDARAGYFFAGSNFDFFVRYRFTWADRTAALNDTNSYSYRLNDMAGSLSSKLVSASSKEVVLKLDGVEFSCIEMLKPYLEELKEDVDKLRKKILDESGGMDAIAAKLDSPSALKAYVIQQKNLFGNSIAAKKRALEKLRSSGTGTGGGTGGGSYTGFRRKAKTLDSVPGRTLRGTGSDSYENSESSYQKISQLENEIYKLQNMSGKFSDQYFTDLVEEYESKYAMLGTEPFRRMKEEGMTEEFERRLSADLKGAEFQIVSKKDKTILKRLNITEKNKAVK